MLLEIKNGLDVTNYLGVLKWEPPASYGMGGSARGNFPSHLTPKTDQERVENMKKAFHKIAQSGKTLTLEETEKLEGMSCTILKNEGDIHVCSRNVDLSDEEGNVYWEVARSSGILDILSSDDIGNISIQGEIVGPKIQGNYYGLNDFQFYVYNIYDIDKRDYWDSDVRQAFTNAHNLKHVPVLGRIPFNSDVQFYIDRANGAMSLINPEKMREGNVYKCVEDPSLSFKAISREYLANQKD